VKGDRNPLTKVIEKAVELVEEKERALLAKYGLPLFVEEGGRNALTTWEPADPDEWTPEQLQVFIDTRGEDAVNAYLAHYFASKAEVTDA
jgi:hypothetical protein